MSSDLSNRKQVPVNNTLQDTLKQLWKDLTNSYSNSESDNTCKLISFFFTLYDLFNNCKKKQYGEDSTDILCSNISGLSRFIVIETISYFCDYPENVKELSSISIKMLLKNMQELYCSCEHL